VVEAGLSSQDGVSQHQEDAPLSIPKLNRLYETSFVRGEDVSNTVVTVTVTDMSAQNKVTLQILSNWQPSGTSNLCLWGRVALNSEVYAPISA